MTDRHDMGMLAEIIYMEQRFLSMILQKPTPPTTTNEDVEPASGLQVARKDITAHVANQMELVEMLKAGTEIEQAGEGQDDE